VSTPESKSPSSRQPTRDGRVRALLVVADPLATLELRRALEAAGADVIAEAASEADGLDRARELAPDIAFVDASIATAGSMAALDLGIRPLVLARDPDPDDAVAAISAGARGYLASQDVLDRNLPRLLDAAMADELVCSRPLLTAVVDRLVRDPRRGAGGRPVRGLLTARETEVLDLLYAGSSTEGIADHMTITVETVRSHIKNLMRKLGVRSRAELRAAAASIRKEGRGPDELLAG
jgi:NarL family two-component system response regulator LiaR